MFDVILLEFSCDTARKMILWNYSQRSCYYSRIIPDSIYHLAIIPKIIPA